MSSGEGGGGREPSRAEFVVLMAALMASNALAIDAMLPALPAIGESLDVDVDNRRQLVITAYLLGFGIAQLAYGPLADRLGRKPLLVTSMILYALFSALAGIAGSFALLLGARALQGVAAAGTRVLVVAIVRDRFEREAMAQIMSLVMIVFMVVPVLAPAFGQLVLAFGTWHLIFFALALYGVALAIWGGSRMPETLPSRYRRSLSLGHIASAAAETLRNRPSIGNTIAMTLTLGALFAFIGSIQQIVFDVFGRPDLLAFVFACIALPMAGSSFANSRLVMRMGSRRLLKTALLAFTLVSLVHLAVVIFIGETIWFFVLLQALTMACFGFVGSNAGALAMAPLGHVAGTASSFQGFITTVGGALVGFAIGQLFDGTTLPMVAGFAVCGGLGLAAASWANRPFDSWAEIGQPAASNRND